MCVRCVMCFFFLACSLWPIRQFRFSDAWTCSSSMLELVVSDLVCGLLLTLSSRLHNYIKKKQPQQTNHTPQHTIHLYNNLKMWILNYTYLYSEDGESFLFLGFNEGEGRGGAGSGGKNKQKYYFRPLTSTCTVCSTDLRVLSRSCAIKCVVDTQIRCTFAVQLRWRESALAVAHMVKYFFFLMIDFFYFSVLKF